MLIQKLSLLVLLLQQLVVQLSQQSAVLPPPVATKPIAADPAPVETPKLETPAIIKVEPVKGGVGTRVTISGSGFDRNSNIVYTGIGTIVVPSPDGETLSFILPRPPFLTDKWLSSTADYRRENYGGAINFPLGFYVKNKNGVTAEPGLFSLVM